MGECCKNICGVLQLRISLFRWYVWLKSKHVTIIIVRKGEYYMLSMNATDYTDPALDQKKQNIKKMFIKIEKKA